MGFHFPKCSLSLLCLSPISVSWPILLTIFTNFFADICFSPSPCWILCILFGRLFFGTQEVVFSKFGYLSLFLCILLCTVGKYFDVIFYCFFNPGMINSTEWYDVLGTSWYCLL